MWGQKFLQFNKKQKEKYLINNNYDIKKILVVFQYYIKNKKKQNLIKICIHTINKCIADENFNGKKTNLQKREEF